jgi:hypothetical protein
VRIGSAARALAADTRLVTGIAAPAPDYEAVIELTYQMNITPWWYVQADLQVILHPGGHGTKPPPRLRESPFPMLWGSGSDRLSHSRPNIIS